MVGLEGAASTPALARLITWEGMPRRGGPSRAVCSIYAPTETYILRRFVTPFNSLCLSLLFACGRLAERLCSGIPAGRRCVSIDLYTISIALNAKQMKALL